MIKKWLTYSAFLLFIAGVAALYGFAVSKNNAQRIKNLSFSFEGDTPRFLDDEIVNNLLIQNMGNPKNQLNSSLNLHLIERNVLKNKMVDSVEAFLNPEGHLHIKIKERNPIVRIITANTSYYLDDKGLAMPLSDKYTERVALATGINNSEHENEIFILMDFFHKDALFKKQIIGVKRMQNGDFVLQPRTGNYDIVFGTADDIDTKMDKLKVFYKKMWSDSLLLKYREINLKYKDQVVCTY